MRFIGIIPARYASTRFPGKPLALLGGRPIIQHVYERALDHLDSVVVATDDERIMQCVQSFGGRAVMTSTSHRSGTDRCQEAYERVGEPFDVIVNIQGDEPFITAQHLESIRQCFTGDPSTRIATLVIPFTPGMGLAALQNPNSPKVVLDKDMHALYFSRSVIPFLRDVPPEEWLSRHTFYKHLGLYAYRPETLRLITSLPQGNLERMESLEQLRWLENGIAIKVAVTHTETIGIDTPADLARAQEFLKDAK